MDAKERRRRLVEARGEGPAAVNALAREMLADDARVDANARVVLDALGRRDRVAAERDER